MDRKFNNILIIVLSIGLITSGIVSLSLIFQPKVIICGFPPPTLILGTDSGPYDLDPVRSWDSASNDVIEQVCEGLFQYNLSDPDLGIIPMLAKDYGTWDITGTEFTVPLRRNVYFHDGAPFNADAVKWNFERINFFINASGTLDPAIGISHIHSLYEFPNGTTILDPITPITINSAYSVTINLRAPYAILESLLCYVTAYMLSPTSTPAEAYIETADGDLVGTGPFVYDHYIADTEVKIHRWERYWRTGAFFEEVLFAIMEDNTERNNAMLGHTIDYLADPMSSLFPTFNADPTITHHSDIPSLSYYFLNMNNEKINKTWRQAISYAINYTYIIDELQEGSVYRSNGPLAPGFPGYDPNIQAADYNLTKARELVVSMGFGYMNWSDAQWQAVDFETWNYTYPYYKRSDFREDLFILLHDNLDLIGIELLERVRDPWSWWLLDWDHYLDWLTQGFIWCGWGPDYLSPFNMITPLFSNKSGFNVAHYHNHTIEMWLDEILQETNATKRAELYSRILHQIVEVDMPHVFGYHPYQHYVHSADTHGVPYNALGSFYAYPIYRA